VQVTYDCRGRQAGRADRQRQRPAGRIGVGSGFDQDRVEWPYRRYSRLAKGAMRCLWLAPGNNDATTGELARRIVRCRIDAGVPQPHIRTGFKHPDLRAWAKAERPRLIWAILTLVQNCLALGRPAGQITLGSYEGYCRVIGGILCAAGIDGFLSTMQTDQRRADNETAE
jgi:hypothetical protein